MKGFCCEARHLSHAKKPEAIFLNRSCPKWPKQHIEASQALLVTRQIHPPKNIRSKLRSEGGAHLSTNGLRAGMDDSVCPWSCFCHPTAPIHSPGLWGGVGSTSAPLSRRHLCLDRLLYQIIAGLHPMEFLDTGKKCHRAKHRILPGMKITMLVKICFSCEVIELPPIWRFVSKACCGWGPHKSSRRIPRVNSSWAMCEQILDQQFSVRDADRIH